MKHLAESIRWTKNQAGPSTSAQPAHDNKSGHLKPAMLTDCLIGILATRHHHRANKAMAQINLLFGYFYQFTARQGMGQDG